MQPVVLPERQLRLWSQGLCGWGAKVLVPAFMNGWGNRAWSNSQVKWQNLVSTPVAAAAVLMNQQQCLLGLWPMHSAACCRSVAPAVVVSG